MNDIEYIVYTDKTVGSLTLKDVCRYMKDHNYNNIEVMDVNRIEHFTEREICKSNRYNLNIEIGIEILLDNTGLSLIGLGVDKLKFNEIEQYIDQKEKTKQSKYRKIIRGLKEKFQIEIDEREILLYTNKKYINIIDLAKLMYKKGYAPSVRIAITKYINKCNFEYFENNLSEIIDTVLYLKSLCNNVYYYPYGRKCNMEQIDDKLGVEEIKIKTFENHQIEDIYLKAKS